MKLPRRGFMHLAGGAAALTAMSRGCTCAILSEQGRCASSSAFRLGATLDIMARLARGNG